MYIVNMALGCTFKETSFISLDDLGNISILLDKDNDLEEETTHLSNEIFIFKFEKKRNQSDFKYTQNTDRNMG